VCISFPTANASVGHAFDYDEHVVIMCRKGVLVTHGAYIDLLYSINQFEIQARSDNATCY